MKRLLLTIALSLALIGAHADTWRYDHVTLARVVDGDTVDLDIDLGFSMRVHERFRLARINTPEKGQPGWAEATAATAARLAAGKITVELKGRDKYGRWLAELYVDGRNLNDSLLADKLAKPYP